MCKSWLLLVAVLLSPSTHASEVQVLDGYRLQYSVETDATESEIWQRWADVDNWKLFDERLDASYLVDKQPFGLGAIGYVKAKGSFKTRFKIVQLEDGVSFVEKLYLPFYQSVELKRYFKTAENGKTQFVHEVSFKGRLRSIMYLILCGAFKKDLKLVVESLKDLAEGKDLKS